MKKRILSILLVAAMVFALFGCSGNKNEEKEKTEKTSAENKEVVGKTELADKNFDTSYQPKKDSYNIYATYKLVHNWYDAIEAGIKAAVDEFKQKGVTVEYTYEAPVEPDAVDQVNKIETAVGQGYDMIAVDVTQIDTTEAAVQDAIKQGTPVALFASSDLPNTDRSFFVGNTDNYGDGEALAEAVCEKMGGKGKIGLMAGTIGAPSHEERLKAFHDVCGKYPDIEIVDEQRDNDFIEKAVQITESWLQAYPDLGGILCNNMSNPIGACQAVKDAGKSGEVVIGGMDHDLRSLEYLKDGTLYVAQVQNCYDMGYKLIYNAVKTIDGEEVEEVTDVGSTSVYQDEAEKYIDLLF